MCQCKFFCGFVDVIAVATNLKVERFLELIMLYHLCYAIVSVRATVTSLTRSSIRIFVKGNSGGSKLTCFHTKDMCLEE